MFLFICFVYLFIYIFFFPVLNILLYLHARCSSTTTKISTMRTSIDYFRLHIKGTIKLVDQNISHYKINGPNAIIDWLRGHSALNN